MLVPASLQSVTEYPGTRVFIVSSISQLWTTPVLTNERATLTGSPLNLPLGPLVLIHPLTSAFRVDDTES